MANQRITTLAVVDHGSVVGMIELADVLVARRRHAEEETRREQVTRLVPEWVPLPPLVPQAVERLERLTFRKPRR
jgi:signal-transduction protein with cAMP-binding, CBS, and nucleotidyltransferase domain